MTLIPQPKRDGEGRPVFRDGGTICHGRVLVVGDKCVECGHVNENAPEVQAVKQGESVRDESDPSRLASLAQVAGHWLNGLEEARRRLVDYVEVGHRFEAHDRAALAFLLVRMLEGERGPGGIATAWPARDVVNKLAEASSILLVDKDYDGHGWELIDTALRVAQAWLRNTQERPANATKCPKHPEDQRWLGDRYETCGACSMEMHEEIMALRGISKEGSTTAVSEVKTEGSKKSESKVMLWGWPMLSKKAHVFVGGRSLCGKWMFLASPERGATEIKTAPSEERGPDDCSACHKKLVAHWKLVAKDAKTKEATAAHVGVYDGAGNLIAAAKDV